MPVVTRSQSRQNSQKNDNINFIIGDSNNTIKHSLSTPSSYSCANDILEKAFTVIIESKLNEIDKHHNKSDKLFLMIYLFMYINENFPSLLKSNPMKWMRFAKIIMEKSFEIDEKFYTLSWNDGDKDHIRKLQICLIETRKFIWPFIKDAIIL